MHLGKHRLADAGNAGDDAEVGLLQNGLRPLEARVGNIPAQPLADPLKMPVRLRKDARDEYALKDRNRLSARA